MIQGIKMEEESDEHYIINILSDLFSRHGETRHACSDECRMEKVIHDFKTNKIIFKMKNGKTFSVKASKSPQLVAASINKNVRYDKDSNPSHEILLEEGSCYGEEY